MLGFKLIGEWLKKNQADVVLVAGFVLVAASSFGVGYLTAPKVSKGPLIIEGQTASVSEALTNKTGESGVTSQSTQSQPPQGNEKGLVVASKNSKIYHWPWCAAAKKIKSENQIWFKSESEAQAAGYARCADFEKLAPAGYKAQ